MSGSDDYDSEMFRPHPLDDATIEAFFIGQGADGELAPLAGFVDNVRSVASGPVPVPSVRLAAMLAKGFSTESGDRLVTAASNVPGPARQAAGLPKRRKKKMMVAELLAGLSVAAKAAFGLTAAAAAVTAGGAAGVLPGPAQHAVATGVEAVTPFTFPDEADDKAEFGGTVSTDARNSGVDGKAVSADARANAGASAGAQPSDPGQNGLDQANTTPAAGHAPTSVPSGRPASAGAQASTGLGVAGSTPAAGHVPTSVPAGPPASTPAGPPAGPPAAGASSQSSAGLGTASSTPAGSFLPGSVPPARPGRP